MSRQDRLKRIFSDLNVSADRLRGGDTEFEERLAKGAVDILEATGYTPENIFVNIHIETPKRVRYGFGAANLTFEVIVAERVTAPPYLVVKTAFSSEEAADPPNDGQLQEWDMRLLNACTATAKAEYTLILTNAYLAVAHSTSGLDVYVLSEITGDEIKEILDDLTPPDEYPEGQSDHFPAGHHPHQTKLTRWLFPDSEITPEYRSVVDSDFFNLDISEYSQKLYKAYTAEGSNEKGESLEDVVKYLFERLSLVEVRDRNLRTRTGEIDLVLEYKGSDSENLFDRQSRYVLIECKNVGESVSTKEVSHFEKKLVKSDTSLGLLFAWNGVSGEDTGDYAQRLIDSDSSDETTIIVIDSRDLYRILDGKSLYKIIDEKMYSLRFDL